MTDAIFEGDNIAADKLPIPSGWRILVAPVKVSEKTSGGIYLPGEVQKAMEFGRFVAKVRAVGNGAYMDDKFQGGVSIEKRTPEHWAKVGDYVIIGQYSGQLIPVQDEAGNIHNLKLLNDDEVLATVPDISAMPIAA